MIAFFWLAFNALVVSGILYPQRNEIRSLDSLDGLWTFVRESGEHPGIGMQNKWYNQELSSFPNATKMPVPSAFNELSPDRDLRLHVGWVWYQTVYRALLSNQKRRLLVRFGSVQYSAKVFINGELAGEHVGGHLPFDVEMPSNNSTQVYYITVAVNNTLHSGTIPPGDLQTVQHNHTSYLLQTPNFDFFNYAGILRPVQVQVLGQVFLHSLKIFLTGKDEFVYMPKMSTSNDSLLSLVKLSVCLFGPSGVKISCLAAPKQFGPIEDVQLWWPRGYGRQPLYTLEISIYVDSELVDVYRETFGFRSVALKDNQLYINGQRFYCMGFGTHEDFDLHGRGYDPVVMTRDLNMFEWYFNENNLKLHESILRETIERDFNRPSVIIWSISNEPLSFQKEAKDYFERLVKTAKSLDPHRFVTVVFGPSRPFNDKAAEFLDIVCVNRYDGWYLNLDHPEVVDQGMYDYIKEWSDTFKKPIIVTEYGGEALPGYYAAVSIPFTEQYQVELLKQNHRAFNRLIRNKVITGEMVWNFADFMTAATLSRPFGNHKGVLTRQREPKASAFVMKDRYAHLTSLSSHFH